MHTMKNFVPLTCLAIVALLTASCSKSATSALPPAAGQEPGGMSNQTVASAANVPAGWAATNTKAVPIGSSQNSRAAATLPDTVPMRIVVGLAMRDRAGAQDFVRRLYTPGETSFHAWMTPAQFTAAYNPTLAQAQSVAS